jgi:hypothetical protein
MQLALGPVLGLAAPSPLGATKNKTDGGGGGKAASPAPDAAAERAELSRLARTVHAGLFSLPLDLPGAPRCCFGVYPFACWAAQLFARAVLGSSTFVRCAMLGI